MVKAGELGADHEAPGRGVEEAAEGDGEPGALRGLAQKTVFVAVAKLLDVRARHLGPGFRVGAAARQVADGAVVASAAAPSASTPIACHQVVEILAPRSSMTWLHQQRLRSPCAVRRKAAPSHPRSGPHPARPVDAHRRSCRPRPPPCPWRRCRAHRPCRPGGITRPRARGGDAARSAGSARSPPAAGDADVLGQQSNGFLGVLALAPARVRKPCRVADRGALLIEAG